MRIVLEGVDLFWKNFWVRSWGKGIEWICELVDVGIVVE